jgi:hypothetical protein
MEHVPYLRLSHIHGYVTQTVPKAHFVRLKGLGGCVAAERKTGKFDTDGKMHGGFSKSDDFEKPLLVCRDRRKYNGLAFSKTVLEFFFSKSDFRDEFRERRTAHASLVVIYGRTDSITLFLSIFYTNFPVVRAIATQTPLPAFLVSTSFFAWALPSRGSYLSS